MRLTNEQLLEAQAALAQLAQVPLKPQTAARVARLSRQLEARARTILGARNRLVEQNAQRDESGAMVPASGESVRTAGMIRIDGERRDAFEAAIVELLSETVEIDLPPLRLDDLTRASGQPVDVPAGLLIALGPLFDDQEGRTVE